MIKILTSFLSQNIFQTFFRGGFNKASLRSGTKLLSSFPQFFVFCFCVSIPFDSDFVAFKSRKVKVKVTVTVRRTKTKFVFELIHSAEKSGTDMSI